MNCEAISRIVDTIPLTALPGAERREAEAHVAGCRRCAAVWGTHVQVAGLPVPPVPPELLLRCQALLLQPARARGAHAIRRLALVGSLLGIAAAATFFIGHWQDPVEMAGSPLSARSTEPAGFSAGHVELVADIATATSSARVNEAARPESALPLLPRPVEADRSVVEDLALELLVARHSELVEGPELEDGASFQGAISLRRDGVVVSSTVAIATRWNAYEVNHQVVRTLPTDAGSSLVARRQKDTKISDGRSLRANLAMTVTALPGDYNASRSTLRVRDILGDRYNHLLLPSAGGMLNRLTVLLSADGTILRDHVELERQQLSFSQTRADDPNDVARIAEARARRLGVDASQIGLMGATSIEDGTIKLVDNGTIGGLVEDNRRELKVSYAWKRGNGESSPTLRQEGVSKPPVDLASALSIVEQELPEAFTRKLAGPEAYLVVMGADGRFVRAGRVVLSGTPDMFARQLVPGVSVNSLKSVRITNKTGATADVNFVWEVPADR